ncbi:MAG: family 10 glycosylhydrolase [Phycisphaeraceae bacterium]|nr:family 10 glycosylhydrolase [Phycisphaeraceae bacterium]
MKIRHLVIGVLALLCFVPGCSAVAPRQPAQASEFRGVWVTRWDYRTREDVRQIMSNAAAIATTDVFFQVRGQADAFYESRLEVWGHELLTDLPAGRTEPGFDPLAEAVREAHRRGMRIHAWINVFPAWKGTTPPENQRHLYHTRPQWRLHDGEGRAQPLNDHYVILNPVLPEVHDHIVEVSRDIARRYAVDGLHLDYVRFVADTMDGKTLYPGDLRSIQMFRSATGRRGVDSAEDRAAYREWIASRITDLVRRIGSEAALARPGVVLTAAVWRRPDLARDQQLQQSDVWLRERTLARAIPMVYTTDDRQFADDLRAWREAAPGRPISPGIGSFRHGPGQTPRQIELAGLDRGYCLFAYHAFFESANPEEPKDAASIAKREALRHDLIAYLRQRGVIIESGR